MIYWLWRVALALVRFVPPRVSYAVAGPVADVAWLFMPVQRRNAVENMTQVVGSRSNPQAKSLARGSFRNYAKYVIDFMRHPQINPDDLMARLDFDDWHEFDAALAEGRGILLVLMHFGNWDLGGAALTAHGYTLNVIAETQAHSRFNDAIVAARLTRGMKLIPMERAATGIVRAIRRNEILAILIDRPLTEGGVAVQFFHAETRVPEGPARIALRTGARVFPVSLLPIADRVRAIIDFDVRQVHTGNMERDVQSLTQQIMISLERVIRQHPDQWYMFRRMWPAGAKAETPPAVTAES